MIFTYLFELLKENYIIKIHGNNNIICKYRFKEMLTHKI